MRHHMNKNNSHVEHVVEEHILSACQMVRALGHGTQLPAGGRWCRVGSVAGEADQENP